MLGGNLRADISLPAWALRGDYPSPAALRDSDCHLLTPGPYFRENGRLLTCVTSRVLGIMSEPLLFQLKLEICPVLLVEVRVDFIRKVVHLVRPSFEN
jgi:hypothetical protein